MTPENTSKLISSFPKLYRDAHSSSLSKMRYGLNVEDGWYDLIHNLSKNIESEAKNAGIDPESNDWPLAIQVKEKFGSLKFYCLTGSAVDQKRTLEVYGEILSYRPLPSNQSIAVLILEAEKKSIEICESCGSKGVLRGEGRLKTLCDACFKQKSN